MTIDDKIRDEKLQYNINREAAKKSALLSGKIDKYEYLTAEETLPFDQSRIIEQANFTYSSLGKVFEKQIKTIENQGIKQVEASKVFKPEENWELEITEGLFPKKIRNEIKNELDKIKKSEEKIKRKPFCDFQQYGTIRSFGESTYAGKITADEAEKDRSNLLKNILEFNEKFRPEQNKAKIK